MKWRYGLIVPVVAVAYLAGANALVNATRAGAPGTALSVNASDGGALVAEANQKWAAGVQQGKVLDLSAPAQKALRTAPLSSGALRLMGYGADVKGNAKRAERLNLLATKVTRREKGAQFWLMEAAVARNDVKGALARYDVLLTTDYAIRDQLFPQLALALSDPEIRSAFVPYVRKAPSWLMHFVAYSAGESSAPEALSYAIRQAGGLPKTEDARRVETALLAQLLAKQRFPEARAFYATLRGADAKVTISSAFDDANTEARFAPLTWYFEKGANAGSDLVGKGTSRAMRAYALSGETGVVAQKYLFLAPGTYRFTSEEQISVNSANARAFWTVRCFSQKDTPSVMQHDVIRSTQIAVQKASFVVSTQCAAQRLELSLSGGDGAAGFEVQINRVSIGPL
jgi:hypothetical protein